MAGGGRPSGFSMGSGSQAWPVHFSKFAPAPADVAQRAMGRFVQLRGSSTGLNGGNSATCQGSTGGGGSTRGLKTRGTWLRTSGMATLTITKRIDSRTSTISVFVKGRPQEQHYVSTLKYVHCKRHALQEANENEDMGSRQRSGLKGSVHFHPARKKAVIFVMRTESESLTRTVRKFALGFDTLEDSLACFSTIQEIMIKERRVSRMSSLDRDPFAKRQRELRSYSDTWQSPEGFSQQLRRSEGDGKTGTVESDNIMCDSQSRPIMFGSAAETNTAVRGHERESWMTTSPPSFHPPPGEALLSSEGVSGHFQDSFGPRLETQSIMPAVDGSSPLLHSLCETASDTLTLPPDTDEAAVHARDSNLQPLQDNSVADASWKSKGKLSSNTTLDAASGSTESIRAKIQAYLLDPDFQAYVCHVEKVWNDLESSLSKEMESIQNRTQFT